MKKVTNLPKRLVNFLKGIIREMKLVDFPSRKETFNKTNVVVGISIAFTLLLFGFDTLFTYLRSYLTNL